MISDPGKTPHVTVIEEYTFAFVASSFPWNKKGKISAANDARFNFGSYTRVK